MNNSNIVRVTLIVTQSRLTSGPTRPQRQKCSRFIRPEKCCTQCISQY